MDSVANENAIRALVKTAVESYAVGFQSRLRQEDLARRLTGVAPADLEAVRSSAKRDGNASNGTGRW